MKGSFFDTLFHVQETINVVVDACGVEYVFVGRAFCFDVGLRRDAALWTTNNRTTSLSVLGWRYVNVVSVGALYNTPPTDCQSSVTSQRFHVDSEPDSLVFA